MSALPPPNNADLAKHAVIRKLLGTFAYWPDLFVPRRKRHAFDHSNYHFDSVADWSIANLAVQRRLGLLSRRRAWAYSHYRNHSGADGPYLNTSLLLKWRLGARRTLAADFAAAQAHPSGD
jgi:hypothetical protein